MTGFNKKTLIIAEAGVNHNGDMTLAFQLIEKAAEAGANIVKFQTFRAVNLVSASAPKADYQKLTTDMNESQKEIISKLEIPEDAYPHLIEHCRKHGIEFLSTPFDLVSVDFLANLNLQTFKIPSGEITNLPYLRKIGALGCNIILSTGMSTLEEVRAALTILKIAGTPYSRISLLHCTTEYPAPFDSVNLQAMQTMRKAFPDIAGVGYSDHTLGITIPIAAAAMGATIIEKHFTIDKNLYGPDHKASLEPDELAEMVKAIRQVEHALGNGEKVPQPSEIANRDVVRKSLVAATTIKKGDFFSEQNVTAKRPGTGISPMQWDNVIGQVSKRDYAQDDIICFE